MRTGFSAAPSIYGHKEREAEQSVNFVTCHDGFTLNDLVSYNHKHNQENGEGNRDGADDNRSWNCGVEGPSDDPAVESLRNRQVKNFLTVTMLSLGVPMIVMGDEVRRTQRGNNNAYCQDNETSWFDWTLLARHADVHRFVKLLLDRRLLRDVEREHRRMTLNQLLHDAKHAWHGVKLNQPDWRPESHSLAINADLPVQNLSLHLILNAYWEPLDFELPAAGNGPKRGVVGSIPRWIRRMTSWNGTAALPVRDRTYHAGPRSVVVLIAGKESVDGLAADCEFDKIEGERNGNQNGGSQRENISRTSQKQRKLLP